MTKVQLLKWLDGKQREALAEVKEQRQAAQERLLAMKIKKTYETVAGNVRGMANAKQAAEYLKGLGFDLSKLETDAQAPTTALAAPVDRSYLLLEVEHEKG